MAFWKGRKVVVTGGAGFIGSHLVEHLVSQGAHVRVADRHAAAKNPNLSAVVKKVEMLKTDLSTPTACLAAAKGQDALFHLAGRVAGVAENSAMPGTMFRDNVLVNTLMLDAARKAGVERTLLASSACVYRRHCSIPTPESEGFLDDPEPTNFGYGWAKRVAEVQARAYAMEFGMKIAVARPYNAYGPRDNFDPKSSHVIAALIRRVLSGENPLAVWGTGEQSRSFLYVTDFAEALAVLLEKRTDPDPINLVGGEEVKLKDVIAKIVKLSGRKTKVVFDPSKPAGQPRRLGDGGKALKLLGWKPRVTLEEGLARTIAWYSANR
jgi:GDP-L-fucose synthase